MCIVPVTLLQILVEERPTVNGPFCLRVKK